MSRSRIERHPRRLSGSWPSVALAAALFAALAVPHPLGASGDRLIIGCSLSGTPPQAMTAAVVRKAYDLVAETVNTRGGVRVGERRLPLEIRFRDDGGDPAAAGRAAEALVEDGVDLLLGGAFSAQTLAVAAVAERTGTPMVQGSWSGPAAAGAGRVWSFGTLPGAEAWLLPAIPFLRSLNPAPASVGVLWSDDDFDRRLAAGFVEEARAAGLRVVVREVVPQGARDLGDAVSVLGQAAPDALVVAGYAEELRLLLRQARERGVKPGVVLTSAAIGDRRVLKALGADAEGLCAVVPWDAQADYRGDAFGSAGDFGRLWKERRGEDPDHRVAAAASAVLAAVGAVERAGSTDRGAVRDALAALDLPTVFGTLAFLPDGRRREGTRVIQIQDGKPVTLGPGVGPRPAYRGPGRKP